MSETSGSKKPAFTAGILVVLVLLVGSELILYSNLIQEKKKAASLKSELSAATENARALQVQIDNLLSEKSTLEDIVISLKQTGESAQVQQQSLLEKIDQLNAQIKTLSERFAVLAEDRRRAYDTINARARKIRRTVSQLSDKIQEQKGIIDLGSIVAAKEASPVNPEPTKPVPAFVVKGKNSAPARVAAVNPEFSFVVVELARPIKLKIKDPVEIMTEDGHIETASVEMVDNALVALSPKTAEHHFSPAQRLIVTKL